MITGCLRAGYGIFDPKGIIPQVAAPLLGREQSVQKAELMAAAHALAISPNILHLFIDNLYVVKGLQRIQYGVPKAFAHQALWHAIYAMRHKIAQVTWIEAHMTAK